MYCYKAAVRRYTPVLTSHVIRKSSSTALPVLFNRQRRLLPCTLISSSHVFHQPVRYSSFDSFEQWADSATDETRMKRYFDSATQNDIVFFLQEKLIEFHDYTGLPWWGVIMCATVALRTLILPLAIHQQYVIARLENVDKEMDTTAKEKVTAEIRRMMKEKNLTEKQIRMTYNLKIHDERMALLRKYNCHPFKHVLVVLIQLPVWTFMSGAIRNINSMIPVQDAVAYTAYLEMKASGFGFLKDLTVPDDTFIIPVLLLIINSTIIHTNQAAKKYKYSRLRNIVVKLAQGICILSFFISSTVPKCLSLYWLTSSAYGLFQNFVFMSPKCRQIFRIPKTPTNVDKPFYRMNAKIKHWINFWRY